MTSPGAPVLRVGVAGLGEAATEFLPDYARHDRVRLVACADRRPAAREQFEKDFAAKAYEDVRELCEAPDVDVIVVATNHEFHREPTVWAAEAGKHVIVEKPMALTLADCDAMIAACERHGVVLVGGHNHSYDAPIRKMREVVAQAELGPLRMVNSWNYNDFMVRPYPARHLAESEGVVLNQGAHHVDIVRLLAGGKVRSVRASLQSFDLDRPGYGAYCCFLEFDDGVPATLVYNGYGLFDTAELFGWLGEGGQPRQPDVATRSRQNFLALDPAERDHVVEDLKERLRYGSVGLGERATMPPGWEKGGRPPGQGELPTHQPFFGLTVVTCDRGDIRQAPDGLRVYGDECYEIPVTGMASARHAEVDELYDAVVRGRQPIHDGRWGKASIEVCLAMIQSAAERREVPLHHQVALPDGV